MLTFGAAFGVYTAVYEYFFSQNQSEENLYQEQIVLYKVPDFVGHKFSDIIENIADKIQIMLVTRKA